MSPVTMIVTMMRPAYPACAAIVALAAWAAWSKTHQLVPTLLLALLAALLVTLAVIDFATYRIPNVLTAAMAALSVLWIAGGHQSWQNAMAGCLAGGGIAILVKLASAIILRRPALGSGDVKLMAASGLWLGFLALPAFLIAGGALGIATGLCWRVTRKNDQFPFGPALAASCYFCLLLTLKGWLP